MTPAEKRKATIIKRYGSYKNMLRSRDVRDLILGGIMVEWQELKKVLLSGKKESLVSMQKSESVIARVVSYLRNKPRVEYEKYKTPRNKPIGKVIYTVQSTIDPISFKKKKDAVAFKKLLQDSNNSIKGDIVRREVTDEGFEPTYGG